MREAGRGGAGAGGVSGGTLWNLLEYPQNPEYEVTAFLSLIRNWLFISGGQFVWRNQVLISQENPFLAGEDIYCLSGCVLYVFNRLGGSALQ